MKNISHKIKIQMSNECDLLIILKNKLLLTLNYY